MKIELIFFGVSTLIVLALIFVSKRWGSTGTKQKVSKDTLKEVTRISGEASDANREVDTTPDSKLDDELRKLGRLKTDS